MMASHGPSFKQGAAGRLDRSHVNGRSPMSLEEAVLQTVAYSDIFAYPLTTLEIHRYLIGVAATTDEVQRALSSDDQISEHLVTCDGFVTLAGREDTIATRRLRQQRATGFWQRAIHYGRMIASLPFVDMVAVTGELAMDNVGSSSDIDYFIVTEPDRLWLARLMVVSLVRYADRYGDTVCPNFLLSRNALEIEERNLYTAHEIAQMVPISGFATYRVLRELNGWVFDFLPNASGPPRYVRAGYRGRPARLTAETVLRTGLGSRIEQWEMNRKIRKFTRDGTRSVETSYSRDRCKGHVDGHGERILNLFDERWETVKGSMA